MSFFVRNEHSIDRVIRVVIGVALIVAAMATSGILQILAGVGAVIMFFTAASGFCPLYRIFGISTCAVPQK